MSNSLLATTSLMSRVITRPTREMALAALKAPRQLRIVTHRRQELRQARAVVTLMVRNGAVRLPYFLEYYRKLGVQHFLIVDNGSDDGSLDILQHEPDCSVWSTTFSYARARHGMAWANYLNHRYCHNKWVLTLDSDEFFVYPEMETRSFFSFLDYLDEKGSPVLHTPMIDMYPRTSIAFTPYESGMDPLFLCAYFDRSGYTFDSNNRHRLPVLIGGPRHRRLSGNLDYQIVQTKFALARWQSDRLYTSSTHFIRPKRLYRDAMLQGQTSGALLHQKFLGDFKASVDVEVERKEHCDDGKVCKSYRDSIDKNPEMSLFDENISQKYENTASLVKAGLMHGGDWASRDV